MRKRTNLVKGLLVGAVLAGGAAMAAPATAAVVAPQALPTCDTITITITATVCPPSATPTPTVTTLEAPAPTSPSPNPTCTPTCATCGGPSTVTYGRRLLNVGLLVGLGIGIG
ncbi:hypothetical protein F5972_11325 [Microbispora cellulosiformans]|uniref:Uncharacterized protein n=1 Tax=Microbispora cellulosiformans TaxID=2614688 RepID=A0A5J5K5D5_9ACTN|nr:hypothetical protein [Microbispora cellulosiformans]KAA9378830.1 hypothetical protein F5972_11325 [Microbispora cellulosiformans]